MMRQTGFTKVDVLVTILCVSVLVLCLGAVGLNGREMAKRTVCASNINQNLEALLVYASDFDGELPKARFGGWLQDLPYIYAYKFVQDYGMHKEAFYCPSNNNTQRVMDAFYYFNVSPENPTNYSLGSFTVTGYIYLLESKLWTPSRPPIQGSGDKQWLGDINADNPDQAELVVDLTFSVAPRPGYPNGDFEHIAGGIYLGSSASGLGAGFWDSSNHLKTIAEPWGGNIGFLDGHVDWRPFYQMERRYSPSPLTWWW
jgi:prepilin-type processing-associated H-X9-DG protein